MRYVNWEYGVCEEFLGFTKVSKMDAESATYIHCRSHILNLTISSGCTAVMSIRNLFDNVNKLTWFLSGSAKRKEIFLEIAVDIEDDLLDILTAEEDDD